MILPCANCGCELPTSAMSKDEDGEWLCPTCHASRHDLEDDDDDLDDEEDEFDDEDEGDDDFEDDEDEESYPEEDDGA